MLQIAIDNSKFNSKKCSSDPQEGRKNRGDKHREQIEKNYKMEDKP